MILRCQVILKTKDALPANWVTNSWCIETANAPSSAALDEYTAAFKDFYDDVSAYLSVILAQNGHEVKYIDLESILVPNYPYDIDSFNLAANPSGATLPEEVAVCLSFQGPKVSGQPQARRRGRIYLGPMTSSSMDTGRPSSTARTVIATAAIALTTALQASLEPATLSVWSQVDGSAVGVTDGWIDNAYDTQRSRGIQPTTRTVWDAA